MDTDVTPAALQSIAGRLSSAEGDAQGFTPAATPNAGACTGILAAAMGAYTDTLADLVDGLSGAAQKVRDSHGSFGDTEQRNRGTFQHTGDGH